MDSHVGLTPDARLRRVAFNHPSVTLCEPWDSLPFSMNFFATCAVALEPILADELRALGADSVSPGRGGVSFTGDHLILYRANLWLRTAVRVLLPIVEARVRNPEELYEAVQTIDWSQYMTPRHTLAVDCNVRDSGITHSLYAALKTKDAICDQFIARCGKPRASIRKRLWSASICIFIRTTRFSVSIRPANRCTNEVIGQFSRKHPSMKPWWQRSFNAPVGRAILPLSTRCADRDRCQSRHPGSR